MMREKVKSINIMINIGYTKDMNRYSNQLIFDILTTGEERVKNW